MATALAVAIAPIYIIGDMYASSANGYQALYELCMERAEDRPVEEMSTAMDVCWDQRWSSQEQNTLWSWKNWREIAV